MRVATWNVNGLQARHTELLFWLNNNHPDIIGLQEIKTSNTAFLHSIRGALKNMGYYAEFHSEPRFNGVAIVSKSPITVTQSGLPGQESRGTRLLAAVTSGWSFTNVCVPNEPGAGGPKLTWLKTLVDYLRHQQLSSAPSVLCGDFNIAPEPIDNGVYNPQGRTNTNRPGYRKEERSALLALRELGWFDLVRKANPTCRMFTYWNTPELYRQNKGLRIDMIFGNRTAHDRVQGTLTDRRPLDKRNLNNRKDHAPVIVDLA